MGARKPMGGIVMTQETRNYVTEKVQAILAAESCCPELKEIGMEWLQASGGDQEAAATKALLHELEEDVNTIDDTIAFLSSPAAAAMLGAEVAQGMAAQAREHKAAGGTHCFCPACANGKAILDIRDRLL